MPECQVSTVGQFGAVVVFSCTFVINNSVWTETSFLTFSHGAIPVREPLTGSALFVSIIVAGRRCFEPVNYFCLLVALFAIRFHVLFSTKIWNVYLPRTRLSLVWQSLKWFDRSVLAAQTQRNMTTWANIAPFVQLCCVNVNFVDVDHQDHLITGTNAFILSNQNRNICIKQFTLFDWNKIHILQLKSFNSSVEVV